MRYFFGVTTDDLLRFCRFLNVKKNATLFKLFWYKVFVHGKLKLPNFLMDSVLKVFAIFSYSALPEHLSQNAAPRHYSARDVYRG